MIPALILGMLPIAAELVPLIVSAFESTLGRSMTPEEKAAADKASALVSDYLKSKVAGEGAPPDDGEGTVNDRADDAMSAYTALEGELKDDVDQMSVPVAVTPKPAAVATTTDTARSTAWSTEPGTDVDHTPPHVDTVPAAAIQPAGTAPVVPQPVVKPTLPNAAQSRRERELRPVVLLSRPPARAMDHVPRYPRRDALPHQEQRRALGSLRLCAEGNLHQRIALQGRPRMHRRARADARGADAFSD